MMKSIAKLMSPLCFLSTGELVCYKCGRLYLMRDDIVVDKFRVFMSFREICGGRIKLFSRLFRLGVRACLPLSDDILLLSVSNKLFEYDLKKRQLSKGFDLQERIRPLTFTKVCGVKGFDDMIVFGGYLSNMDKKPVHVYKRVGKDRWEVVYTFQEKAINHIHNIVPDPYRGCLWIFTGDFGSSAAIWKVTENFMCVKRVFSNDQQYRACAAYALPEGVLYVTDTPFVRNHIYLLEIDGEEYHIRKVSSFDGSCIYSCQWKDKYVFSSTVEADGNKSQPLIKSFFDRKRGKGIKDENVYLYLGNLQEGFQVIYKIKKDIWPFIFQFGVFRFPCGENRGECLYFQPIATKINDLDLLKYHV